MGNTLLCLPHTPCSPVAPLSSTKLVNGLTGRVQRFHDCAKVAEIMLENPGNFVCNSNCFRAGKRFEALPADQELKKGQLYFILPMHRRNKRASAEELGFLLASSTNQRSSHYSFKHTIHTSTAKLFGAEKHTVLLPSSRSWKPNLQTISERPTAGYDGKLKQLMERPNWAQECVKVAESVESPLSIKIWRSRTS